MEPSKADDFKLLHECNKYGVQLAASYSDDAFCMLKE